MADNLFLSVATDLPLVAVRGARNGYVMIAPSAEARTYDHLPDAALIAAKAWSQTLEQEGSPRAYWLILSELNPHLHIHIFPRWPQDALKGVALFETRDTETQPVWTPALQVALSAWAARHQALIL